MITITIETDNAAFSGDARGVELARIFNKLAHRFERDGEANCNLVDINGNTVGECVDDGSDSDDE